LKNSVTSSRVLNVPMVDFSYVVLAYSVQPAHTSGEPSQLEASQPVRFARESVEKRLCFFYARRDPRAAGW